MAFYLASDVHMRSDRPERARRFARWVLQLENDTSLLIAGDLCDFWMVAREDENDFMKCAGIAALRDFRTRGGSLEILPGNHDLWACPYYERVLGATLVREPYDTTVHGLRLRVVHGHLLGARRKWKGLMESREFKTAFEHLPGVMANRLDQLLERKNTKNLADDEERHISVFRAYAAGFQGQADLVVIGHVHRAVDDLASNPRMIVLGGWQRGSSYLKIDPAGASFHVVADDYLDSQSPAIVSREPSPSAPGYATS